MIQKILIKDLTVYVNLYFIVVNEVEIYYIKNNENFVKVNEQDVIII